MPQYCFICSYISLFSDKLKLLGGKTSISPFFVFIEALFAYDIIDSEKSTGGGKVSVKVNIKVKNDEATYLYIIFAHPIR